MAPKMNIRVPGRRLGGLLAGTVCAAALVAPTAPAQALGTGRCADVLVYAHRGGNIGEHSRNTLPKFRDAFAAGVEGLETDVRPSADEDLVVFHDRAVDGVTDGTGQVDQLTTEYIQSLHTRRGNRIPLYTEFLDLMARKNGKLAIVEVKPSELWTEELFRSALVQPMLDRGLADRVMFSSEVNRYLPVIDALDPNVETAVKGASQRTAVEVLKLADSVTTKWDWPAEYVQQIQDAGGHVVLNAGRPKAWNTALQAGTDGIVVDPLAELLAWCGA
jgi:glycerophosphoryl diester phosphodiesterase